jgi:hypothetical protein
MEVWWKRVEELRGVGHGGDGGDDWKGILSGQYRASKFISVLPSNLVSCLCVARPKGCFGPDQAD